jgi:hypothetical protein
MLLCELGLGLYETWYPLGKAHAQSAANSFGNDYRSRCSDCPGNRIQDLPRMRTRLMAEISRKYGRKRLDISGRVVSIVFAVVLTIYHGDVRGGQHGSHVRNSLAYLMKNESQTMVSSSRDCARAPRRGCHTSRVPQVRRTRRTCGCARRHSCAGVPADLWHPAKPRPENDTTHGFSHQILHNPLFCPGVFDK